MSALKNSTPRKMPVQARSKMTVAAILEATARVLVECGYERTTTNLVAERAGVSIGSLYEYFPNKEALVGSLARAHVEELVDLVDEALRSSVGAAPRRALLSLVRAGLRAHSVNPKLHKVLVEQVPRIGALADFLNISSLLQQKIERDLQSRMPHLSLGRIRMISFVIETCIEALTHRAVLDAPNWLSSGELEKEAMRLLLPYLEETTDRAAAPRRSSSGNERMP